MKFTELYIKIVNFLGPIVYWIIILAIAALILAIPIWFLWNAIIPGIFELREITLLEALGIGILSHILFKDNKSWVDNKK